MPVGEWSITWISSLLAIDQPPSGASTSILWRILHAYVGGMWGHAPLGKFCNLGNIGPAVAGSAGPVPQAINTRVRLKDEVTAPHVYKPGWNS